MTHSTTYQEYNLSDLSTFQEYNLVDMAIDNLYNRIQFLFCNVYVLIYNWYLILWNFIVKMFGSLRFIYLLENDRLNNVTVNYLLGYNCYKNSIYYTKIYQANDYCHYAFEGNLSDIKPIVISKSEKSRKRAMLLNDGMPVDFDMNILDRYLRGIISMNLQNCITDMVTIMKIIGKECTHVQITEINPFCKKIKKIDDLSIFDLYKNG
jgi:hypothetical protein